MSLNVRAKWNDSSRMNYWNDVGKFGQGKTQKVNRTRTVCPFEEWAECRPVEQPRNGNKISAQLDGVRILQNEVPRLAEMLREGKIHNATMVGGNTQNSNAGKIVVVCYHSYTQLNAASRIVGTPRGRIQTNQNVAASHKTVGGYTQRSEACHRAW